MNFKSFSFSPPSWSQLEKRSVRKEAINQHSICCNAIIVIIIIIMFGLYALRDTRNSLSCAATGVLIFLFSLHFLLHEKENWKSQARFGHSHSLIINVCTHGEVLFGIL